MNNHTPQYGKDYTPADLEAMSHEDKVKLGLELDHVNLAFRKNRWPIKGTIAERRAERLVAYWFLLAGILGFASAAIFIAWPWEYAGKDDEGNLMYSLYTPLVGVTLGVAVLAVGIAAIIFTKKFIPEEVAIQDRHDGKSPDVDRATTVAILKDAADSSTITRRRMVIGSGLIGIGGLGVGALTPFLGGFVKNPWADGDNSSLWTSGWSGLKEDENGEKVRSGETVYLRRDTGNPSEVSLVRPEDLDAGGMETVFPHLKSHTDHEELLGELRGIRNAVMLIRLRPQDAESQIKRAGQENFNYGDYVAYSKICTHLGCPTSLFEQQTNRILCPCHQSQFDAMHWGKPVFGPAARALPQLPLTVDSEGYFVAAHDFIEALGPAFWERRS